MLLLGLVDVPMWLILILVCVGLLYWYSTRNHDFYKKHGIPGPKPLPFVGNILDLTSSDFMDVHIKYKEKYGKTIGTFSASTPNLIVFDEDMISQVMVKQFHIFTNRQTMKNDKIQQNMLTNMAGETWKHARSTMSPTFTTGKLRQMADEINRCAKQLTDKLAASQEPFETRELASAYTMDVIASTAFGLRVDSQSSSENPFMVHGKRMMDISFKNPILLVGFLLPPLGTLFESVGLTFWDMPAVNFFKDIIKQAMGTRTDADKSRTDFLQIMYNARQGKSNYSKDDEHEVEKLTTGEKKTGLTEEEVVSNALIFFMAGYDTTSLGLTMLMYCLATNPECQQKLHKEMDDVLADKDSISYDDVMKMTYLDKCLQESLRLYPGAPAVDRLAANDTELNSIPVPKESVVIIPIYAIHMDPEIYPEPDKFDPERLCPKCSVKAQVDVVHICDKFDPEIFSTAEKAKRSPLFWMPFGYGPRNCIAMRLALYEIKVATVHMLRNHKLTTCNKTEANIKWTSGKWLQAENGIWLAAEKRT